MPNRNSRKRFGSATPSTTALATDADTEAVVAELDNLRIA